jgi:hypothetical protein
MVSFFSLVDLLLPYRVFQIFLSLSELTPSRYHVICLCSAPSVMSHRSIQNALSPCIYLSKPPALNQDRYFGLINSSNSSTVYGSKLLNFSGMPLVSSSTILLVIKFNLSSVISNSIESIGLHQVDEYLIRHCFCSDSTFCLYPSLLSWTLTCSLWSNTSCGNNQSLNSVLCLGMYVLSLLIISVH